MWNGDVMIGGRDGPAGRAPLVDDETIPRPRAIARTSACSAADMSMEYPADGFSPANAAATVTAPRSTAGGLRFGAGVNRPQRAPLVVGAGRRRGAAR